MWQCEINFVNLKLEQLKAVLNMRNKIEFVMEKDDVLMKALERMEKDMEKVKPVYLDNIQNLESLKSFFEKTS